MPLSLMRISQASGFHDLPDSETRESRDGTPSLPVFQGVIEQMPEDLDRTSALRIQSVGRSI